MVGTADTVLIREVSLIQSVLYREAPLYSKMSSTSLTEKIHTYSQLEPNKAAAMPSPSAPTHKKHYAQPRLTGEEFVREPDLSS